MYSVRLTTKAHGVTTFHLFLFILILTAWLIYTFGWNYLVIFCASSFVHGLIETGLFFSGLRKGDMYYREFKLPKFLEISLRSMVEGPAFCVPAFFVADQFEAGNFLLAIFVAFLVVGTASFYLGWFDRKHHLEVKNSTELIISRRAMTRPKSLMLLSLVNSICIIALMFIPNADRIHAFTYVFSYAGFVLLFYFINFNLGVRYIESFNHETKAFEKPGLSMQIAGLIYDSAYEMTLLISPAYWLTYYLGLFS
ncbi:MAG: hypothetical protein RIS20_1943 [Bacteroidota bacterium]|jgi:hypothetical protein